jgi:hypothetical protein
MNGTTQPSPLRKSNCRRRRRPIRPKPMRPQAQAQASLQHRISDAAHDLRMLRSKSCTAASAIPTRSGGAASLSFKIFEMSGS